MEVHMSSVAGTDGSDPTDSSLDDVSLDYFEAIPTHIEPFEESRLRWKVEAPVGVHIELAGIEVSAIGADFVEPPASRSYELAAKARTAYKMLGQAHVTVNLARCRIFDLSFIEAIIKAGILADPGALPTGAYFREDPKIVVTPGRIAIHLFLGQDIGLPGIRDPDVTMDMSFGLTVVPDTRPHQRHGVGLALANRVMTRLAPIAEEYTAGVTEPWYVYAFLGPFISVPLSILLAAAQDSVTARIPGIIQRVVDGLDADFHPYGFGGLQKHTVTVGVDEKGVGYLEANWCPTPTAEDKPSTD
jgi:hypothetical protein